MFDPYEDDGYYDNDTEYEARMAYRDERELDDTEDDELSVYDPDMVEDESTEEDWD
jgi:hypothetical protein